MSKMGKYLAIGVLFLIVLMPVVIMPVMGITFFAGLFGDEDSGSTTVAGGQLSDMGFIHPVPGAATVNLGGAFMHPKYADTQGRNHTGLDIANSGAVKNMDVVSPFNGKLVFTKPNNGTPTLCKGYSRGFGLESYYWAGGGGNTVMLVTQLPDNPKVAIFMAFNHLNSIEPRLIEASKGESIEVKQGEIIGKVGGTNDKPVDQEYGPHLHITAGYIEFQNPDAQWDTPATIGASKIVDPLWFFQGLDFACQQYTLIYIGDGGYGKGVFDPNKNGHVYQVGADFKKSTVGCRV